MIRLFRRSGAGSVLVILLAALGVWGQHLIAPPPLSGQLLSEPMPLWGFIGGLLSERPFLAVLFSMLMALAVALVMTRFNVSIFFIPARTFLPAFLYIILSSLFFGSMVLNPALPASLLILAALWRMVSSYRVNGMSFHFFDAALMISSAGLIYAGSVWFLPIVIIGALMLRTPDTRELILGLAGALLPWVVMYAVWYVSDGQLSDLTAIISGNLLAESPGFGWSRPLVILLIVTGINLIPAVGYLIRIMPTCKIRSRKTWEIFLWITVIAVGVFALVPAVSVEMTAIAAIPLSYFLANYMIFTRRVTVAEILFWIMIVALVVSRIWH